MENRKPCIKIAFKNMLPSLMRLSSSTLKPDNEAIYNKEFLCEYGLRSAVAKGYVVVALMENEICGMLRFYPNKRAERISIYQFAVAEAYRGLGIVRQLLEYVRKNYNGIIACKCPINSLFNQYYFKSGWIETNRNDFIIWEWRPTI